jgi:hypothetical protein
MPYVFAKYTTTIGGPHGGTWSITEGEVWDADDPVVKGRPDAFAKTPVRVRTSQGHREVVEQATAAPGERRRTP